MGFGRERLPALLWLLAVKSGHLLEFPGLLKTQTSGPGADRSALCRQWYLGCGQAWLRSRGNDGLALATSVRRAGWWLDLSRRLRDSSVNW